MGTVFVMTDDAKKMIEQAKAHVQNGELKAAISLYKTVCSTNGSNHPQWLSDLGVLYHQDGQFKKVLKFTPRLVKSIHLQLNRPKPFMFVHPHYHVLVDDPFCQIIDLAAIGFYLLDSDHSHMLCLGRSGFISTNVCHLRHPFPD